VEFFDYFSRNQHAKLYIKLLKHPMQLFVCRIVLLMNYLIASSETVPSIQENIKMVTLKQSTNWITSAWNNVESTVVQNCFKHVGRNICLVEKISLENKIRHFIDSANYLSIDCPEIINENIQVHDHVDIENLDSTILNPLHQELVDQEEMENSNLKSGPSISTTLCHF